MARPGQNGPPVVPAGTLAGPPSCPVLEVPKVLPVSPLSGLTQTVKKFPAVITTGDYTSASLYTGTNFTSRTNATNMELRHALKSKDPTLVLTDFEARRVYEKMRLSEGSVRVRDVPNAGGDSVISEVISCEMMTRMFNAKLLKTEMEVEYFPMGGAMTDYVVEMFGERIGVSVTRAMKYRGEYEADDARALLNKKLRGAVNATQNCNRAWTKQILHIWAQNQHVAHTLMTSYYSDVSDDVRADTVVMVTVAGDDANVGIFSTKKSRTSG